MRKKAFKYKTTVFVLLLFISALFMGFSHAQAQDFYILSGTVTMEGAPIQIVDEWPLFASGRVRAVDTAGFNLGNEVNIQEEGQYEMALFPGTYDLDLSYDYSLYDETSGHCTRTLSISHYPVVQNLIVSADTTVDIPAVIYTLSGYVTDTAETPMADVLISTEYHFPGGSWIYSYTHSATDGSYELYLLPGTYSLLVQAPPATFPPFEIKMLHIDGDTIRDIVLSLDYAILEDAIDALSPDLDLHMDVFDIIDQGESKSYEIPVPGPRDEMELIINWEGSEMRAEVFRPDGNLYDEYQPSEPPIKFSILDPDVGRWICEITAVEVPHDNYVFALVADITPNEPPVADANGPYTGSVGSLITFDASGSYDPNGDIVLYEWDWDNDGIYDDSVQIATIEHTWNVVFDGTITLKVTDNEGLTEIDTTFVEIGALSIPGDLDGDGDIDRDDVNIIKAHRNQPASVCPECDIDGDGTITVLDARKLMLMCTCPRCICN